MNKIKIVKADAEQLVFSDGGEIHFLSTPNCYIYHYADFLHIDDIAKEWEFEHPIIFEKCDWGFRFGNKDKMVFVPCYAEQGGYYSYYIDIYYNGDLVLKAVECD